MAEWSKALCLGRSIFGSVGSNPTPVTLFYQFTRDKYPQELLRKTELNQLPRKPRQEIYQENYQKDRMAERSKALRLGRSIFGCVGSNPTPVTFFLQTQTRQISTGIAQKKVRVKSITEQT